MREQASQQSLPYMPSATGPLRCSRSYTERRRVRRKTEVARRINEGNQKEDTQPVSNQFLKCSPPSGTHRDSQSWVKKRGGREETEVTWWRKMRVEWWREQSSQ